MLTTHLLFASKFFRNPIYGEIVQITAKLLCLAMVYTVVNRDPRAILLSGEKGRTDVRAA